MEAVSIEASEYIHTQRRGPEILPGFRGEGTRVVPSHRVDSDGPFVVAAMLDPLDELQQANPPMLVEVAERSAWGCFTSELIVRGAFMPSNRN